MTRLLLALAVSASLSGCAYHSLTVPEPNRGDQFLHPVDSNAIAWGAIEDPKKADKCAGTNSISDVQVRTSFLQSLATVLTLGFWQPSHIRYRCGKLPTGEGEIPH
ncbi:MAG: hypothetical protein ACOYO0_03650 [Sandarakinorhabdus sp.]|jgi:hypothetical protein